jgi:WD40 repeat protein
VNSFMLNYAQTSIRWWDQKRLLFTGGTDHSITSWFISEEAIEERDDLLFRPLKCDAFLGHTGVPTDMLMLPNINSLASSSLDSTICLWDLPTKQPRHILKGHTSGILSMAYNFEYHMLFSAGIEHEVLIWNPYFARCVGRLKGHFESLVKVQCIPDTPQILTADAAGIVKVWDIRTFNCVQTLHYDDDQSLSEAGSVSVGGFTACPTHKRLVMAGPRLKYFDSITELGIDPELTDQSPTVACLFNKHSNSFLTVAGTTARVWSARTVFPFDPITHLDLAAHVCLSSSPFFLSILKFYNYNLHITTSTSIFFFILLWCAFFQARVLYCVCARTS